MCSEKVLKDPLSCSAKLYPLEALMMDCHAYFQQTGRRITLEYTLMEGVNDGSEQVSIAEDLIVVYGKSVLSERGRK